MRIMFCHDGTESALGALKRVVNFFKGIKPEMVLVSVAEEVLDASLEDERITSEYESERSTMLRTAAEWVSGEGLEVDVLMATGDPRKMILEAINKKSPDICVVARKEKSTYESVFQKSLSAYLVKNAGCHLFIMGPS